MNDEKKGTGKMKKMMMIGLMAVLALCGIGAQAADTYQEVTVVVTNSQTDYADLSVGGFIDKVEYTKTGGGTSTITVATFDAAGTTAIDTFVAKQVTADGSGVLGRPRVVGTTTAGVALAAVVGNGSDALTNLVTTVLSVPYERPRAGGNIRVKVASNSLTSTNVVRVYTIPFN